MTTIAYRNGIMAADGRETIAENAKDDGYIVRDNCKKIVRMKDGSLFAGRGVSEDITRVQSALEADKRKMPKGDCTCLWIKPDGSVFLYEGRRFTQVENMPYHAIGSGARYALVAMDAGADAQSAVKFAFRDVWSGGEIQVEPLKAVSAETVHTPA